jgi:hypothetical protein
MLHDRIRDRAGAHLRRAGILDGRRTSLACSLIYAVMPCHSFMYLVIELPSLTQIDNESALVSAPSVFINAGRRCLHCFSGEVFACACRLVEGDRSWRDCVRFVSTTYES